MSKDIYQQWGVRKVINGRSYSTKVGGSLMAPEVLQAMQEAAKSFVRIEDLQEAASEVIAKATGAEAGLILNSEVEYLGFAAKARWGRLPASRFAGLSSPASGRLESRPNWQTRMSAPRKEPRRIAGELRNSG